jgi:two-component system nitrate/nitrite response regulator NarL
MDWSFEVLVVERSPLFREGLNRIIGTGKFRIAAAMSRVEDLPAMPGDHPLLLVLGSSGDPTVTAQEISAFKQKCPDARIVVLAENHDAQDVVMAFRAGANGYLAKLTCHDDLIKSLELVMAGETILSSAILAMILDQRQEYHGTEDRTGDAPPMPPNALNSSPSGDSPRLSNLRDDSPHLSEREMVILSCLANGCSNKVIARRIGSAEATVKVHVKSILRKIRVSNRTQAALWAARNGYVEVPSPGGRTAAALASPRPILDTPSINSHAATVARA